jgi:hypothetical protein
MDAETKRCYPEAEFQAAFNEAFLGYFAAVTKPANTVRKVARSLRQMKNTNHHQAVLGGALRLLREREGEDVVEVHRLGGSVVATFAT